MDVGDSCVTPRESTESVHNVAKQSDLIVGKYTGSNTKKAGTDMNRSLFTVLLFALVAVALGASAAQAQSERDTDTLMVVDTEIPVGDTNAVFIYLVNATPIGGYTLRLEYDHSVIQVVTVSPDNDSTIAPIQLERNAGEGTFEQFYGGHPEDSIVTIVALPGFAEAYALPAGRGNAVQFEFYAQPDVTAGTTTEIRFVDADFDTNAFNWFVEEDASSQYRPTRVTGTITIGGESSNNDPTIDALASPIETFPGNAVNFTVTARDVDTGDQVTLTAFDLPAAALFTPSNPVTGASPVQGTFSWNPTSDDVGSHTVRFQANDDNNGFSSIVSVVIDVSSGGPPVISPITSPISTTEGSLVEFSVTATDPDAEIQGVTLTASNLPSGATFLPSNPISGQESVTGTFRWSPDFGQAGTYVVQFQAEDEFGNQSSITNVTIVVEEVELDELFTTSVEGQSPQGGVPGATGVNIPVNFVTTVETYGVQFDFLYNPSVFTVTDVVPTSRLEGFTIYEDIGENPGRIKVVAFDLAGNPISTEGSIIFEIIGDIHADAPTGRYDISFEDAWESVNPDPNVPSKQLATSDGHVFVDILGDANLDSRIDVGDIVSVVGYILDTYSFTDRQFRAANIIEDPVVDVYDLVGIINLIFGNPVQPAPYDFGDDVFAEVEFNFEGAAPDQGRFKLVSNTPTDVAGIQAEIIYDPLQVKLVPPEPSALAAGLDITYNDNGNGRMRVVMTYDPSDPSSILPAGINELFGVQVQPGIAGVEGELPPVKLRNVKLCTPEASRIHVAGYTEVPKAFELLQNYPNPFNPTTTIEFAIAPRGDGNQMVDARLEVYNILGQRVITLLDEPLPAGRHTVQWDSRDKSGNSVASGIYFYRLTAGDYSQSKKMVLMK